MAKLVNKTHVVRKRTRRAGYALFELLHTGATTALELTGPRSGVWEMFTPHTGGRVSQKIWGTSTPTVHGDLHA